LAKFEVLIVYISNNYEKFGRKFPKKKIFIYITRGTFLKSDFFRIFGQNVNVQRKMATVTINVRKQFMYSLFIRTLLPPWRCIVIGKGKFISVLN